MPALAQHSKATPSWGSPPWLIDIGRRVLQRIDLDGPPLKGEQPTHSSYLALLPSSPEQVERFDAEMRQLGAEVF